MKNKSDGFTSIECVVSLSIICTLVYMVSVSLYNNYFISGNYNDTETINDYEIRKIVEEDEYYYKCYKIVIEVKKKEQIRRLESYVLQQ